MDENPYQSPQTVDRPDTNRVRTPLTFWRDLFVLGVTAFLLAIVTDAASPWLRLIMTCAWFAFAFGALWYTYGSHTWGRHKDDP